MNEASVRTFRRDDFCFACGQQNENGLRLRPAASEGRAVVQWTPPLHYQGYAGVLHGGVISTIMDETMAHAALSLVRRAATAELSLQFLKPVMTGRELEVRAGVRERRRRIVVVWAELIQDGEVRARGEGKFLAVAPVPRSLGTGPDGPGLPGSGLPGSEASGPGLSGPGLPGSEASAPGFSGPGPSGSRP